MNGSTVHDMSLVNLIMTVRNCNNRNSPQGSAVSQWSDILMKSNRKQAPHGLL